MALTDEKRQAMIKCENCWDETAAATRCEECAMFFCSYCSEFHRKSRSTKHHVLSTLQELKSARAGPSCVAEKIRCEKHKEELIKLYCKTCQSTICRDCTIVEHKTHHYGFIEDVYLEQKEILKQNMNEVQQRQATLQKAIANLRQFDKSLIDEYSLIVAQVTNYFDKLQKTVVAKKSELLTEVNSLTNSRRKQILAQIEALEVALASCKSSVEFTEKAFKNGNDVQVLSMQKYILQSLEGLKKVKDVTKPCVTRALLFSIPQSMEDSFKNFLSLFAVDEIIADPDECLAEFADQRAHLKRNQESIVRIICFSRNSQRLQTGGQEIKATISGVKYDEDAIKDNQDGTHTISFTPLCGGTVEVKATIDGRPAPRCSLTKDVEWIFSEHYGNAQLSPDCLSITPHNHRTSTSWRVGECCFGSGDHSWKVLCHLWVNPRVKTFNNLETLFGSCNVGVTSTLDRKPNGFDTCTHAVRFDLFGHYLSLVSLTLSIPNKRLRVVTKYNDSNVNDYEIDINGQGEQFWPFVEITSGNIEASLVYD